MHRRICFASLLAGILCLGGCGPKQVAVKGIVKLDGNPVEGATVDFVADDGRSYSGFTDSGGNFTVMGPDQKSGVPAGTYKVTVVKNPASASGSAEVGKEDYFKQMEKGMKEKAKAGPALMNPMLRQKTSGIKSELPIVYANKETTPITVTVPPQTQPVPIDLKSKQ
jgi:hypothetical protein